MKVWSVGLPLSAGISAEGEHLGNEEQSSTKQAVSLNQRCKSGSMFCIDQRVFFESPGLQWL